MKRWLFLPFLLGLVWLWLDQAWETLPPGSASAELVSHEESDLAAAIASSDSAESAETSTRQLIGTQNRQRDGFVVQVVSADGQPRAGVDVALAWHFAENSEPHVDVVGRSTEPDGKLEVGDFSRRRKRVEQRGSPVVALGVTVRVPGIPAEIVPLSIDILPADVVRLVLPVSGSVVARLVDAGGQPLWQAFHVSLDIFALDGLSSETCSATSDPRSGFARFAAVPLGRRIHAACDCGFATAPEQSIDGLLHDGATWTVTFRLPPECSIFTARLLEPDGAPAAWCTGELYAYTAGHLFARGRGISDAQGRLRLCVSTSYSGRIYESVYFDEDRNRLPTGRRARGRGPCTLHAGVEDLGELCLFELPLLVRVSIVDAQGQSVPGAARQMWFHRRVGDAVVRLLEASAEPPQIRQVGDACEVRGAADLGQLVLSVRAAQFLTAEVPFERGDENLRVVLARRQGG